MKIMEKKPLGKTGLAVPPIIYGTSYLGNLYKSIPYENKLALMKKWFECTGKPVMIDSAGKYGAGLALEIIGKGLVDLGIDPKDIIISNKLGWFRVPLETAEPTFESGVWIDLEYDAIQTFGYDGIINCYHQGNELLVEPYRSDVVSVHDPDEYLFAAKDKNDRSRRLYEILESYRALFDLKKEGKVKAVGIGSKDWHTIKELYENVPFDWVMFANSFTIFHHPDELISFMEQLDQNGVGIINSAIFHGGFLTGGNMFDYQNINSDSEKGKIIYSWRDKFNSICSTHAVNPGDACLQFSTSHPAIVSIALNTSRPEKMERNIEIIQQEIPGDFWQDMKDQGLISQNYKYV